MATELVERWETLGAPEKLENLTDRIYATITSAWPEIGPRKPELEYLQVCPSSYDFIKRTMLGGDCPGHASVDGRTHTIYLFGVPVYRDSTLPGPASFRLVFSR